MSDVSSLNKNKPEETNEEEDLFHLEKHWWSYRHFILLHCSIFLITLSATNTGYDSLMLNGLQSLSLWKDAMGNPRASILGALTSGNVFGNIVAFPFASWLSDTFGRKYVIMFGSFITLIGAILQGVSDSYGFFLGSRIVIGVGSNLSGVSSPTLISELSYPTFRSTTTTFYNVCWYLGAFIAAWVTYGTRVVPTAYSWKIPSYLQGFLPLVQVVFMYWVPESPRFLVSKGKLAQAEKVLLQIHTGNASDERSLKLVAFEMREIEAALEMEKSTIGTKYSDFVTKSSFRKRLGLTLFMAIITQLSGNGLVSYYLNKVLDSIGITEEKRQLEINGYLMFYNMMVSIIIASTVGYFNRRTVFIFCCSSMLVTYIVWTALSAVNQQHNFENKLYGNGVLAMIFLYYFAYNTGANGLPYTYVTEILPYSHRAKGMNILFLAMQVVMVFNGFVNPIAMDAIDWKYYIVYCCVLFVELLIVIFFVVETAGYTLEEVAKVFGDDPEDFIMHLLIADKPEIQHNENLEILDKAAVDHDEGTLDSHEKV